LVKLAKKKIDNWLNYRDFDYKRHKNVKCVLDSDVQRRYITRLLKLVFRVMFNLWSLQKYYE
jgi:hypothetical protein